MSAFDAMKDCMHSITYLRRWYGAGDKKIDRSDISLSGVKYSRLEADPGSIQRC
jgi:hypothetical protein